MKRSPERCCERSDMTGRSWALTGRPALYRCICTPNPRISPVVSGTGLRRIPAREIRASCLDMPAGRQKISCRCLSRWPTGWRGGWRPWDGKTQVSVAYRDGKPVRITTVVLSAQHAPDIAVEDLREALRQKVILPTLPAELVDENTLLYINPTGRFVIGGPAGDSGLTGRKLLADTYGSAARHGGGSISGKDPTKMDRTGAYLARYLAKNIVAAGLAERCEVQLAYAIGLADPVSVAVDTYGTGTVRDEALAGWLEENVDMRPGVIIRRFGLTQPIYQPLACYGHFGENARGMPWERTDLRLPRSFD